MASSGKPGGGRGLERDIHGFTLDERNGLPLAQELANAYLARRAIGFGLYEALLQDNLRQAMPARFASLTSKEVDLYSTPRISEGVLAEEPRLRELLDLLVWGGPAPMGLDLRAALLDVERPAHLADASAFGQWRAKRLTDVRDP